jgi:hypothetical protein
MPKPAAAVPSSRRRRWKIAEARAVLEALASSGLSLPEFARMKRLEPQRLRRWQRQLARRVRRAARTPAPASSATPALIELRPNASLRPAEPIEIVLGSGVTLRVAETIEPAVLARLVTALRGC